MSKKTQNTEVKNKEVLALYGVSKWVAVNERLPKNDTMCLIYRTDFEEVDYAFYEDGFEFPYTNLEENEPRQKYQDVSHWLPIPEPPFC